MHFCIGTKKKLFTVLVWFFVNFARKVSLEIIDKSRPKWMNYFFFFIQLINKWLPKNSRKKLLHIIWIKWGESTHFPGRTGNRGENVDKYLTKRNIYVWSFSHSISWQDFFCAVSKVFDRVKTIALWSAKKIYIYIKDNQGSAAS